MASLPRDANHNPIQGAPPAEQVLEETYDATISSSTALSLQSTTKYIEVAAFAKPVLLLWGTGTAATTNFDVVISQDSVRLLKVPTGISAIAVIEQAASAAVAICEYS